MLQQSCCRNSCHVAVSAVALLLQLSRCCCSCDVATSAGMLLSQLLLLHVAEAATAAQTAVAAAAQSATQCNYFAMSSRKKLNSTALLRGEGVRGGRRREARVWVVWQKRRRLNEWQRVMKWVDKRLIGRNRWQHLQRADMWDYIQIWIHFFFHRSSSWHLNVIEKFCQSLELLLKVS